MAKKNKNSKKSIKPKAEVEDVKVGGTNGSEQFTPDLVDELEEEMEEFKKSEEYERGHSKWEKHAQLAHEQDLLAELKFTEEVPPYVKDEEAFRDWQRVAKNPLMNEKQWQLGSDGELYNLASLKHQLQAKTAHLPIKEREKFMSMKQAYYKVQGKMNQLRRKAFGIKIGNQALAQTNKMRFPVLEPRQSDLLELFGQMFNDTEVHEIVVKQWKLPVSLLTISHFRKAYANLIKEKQDMYKMQAVTDLRLGNKISRLEELCWFYGEFKRKFQAGGSRMDGEAAMKALDQIKRECDGDLSINVSGEVNIQHSINLHLHKEMLKGLPIKQMIISRVANKMGASPLLVVSSLSNSYYSKFSGILGDVDDVEYEDVEYPSGEHYDFNYIQKNALGIEDKIRQERKAYAVEVREKNESVDLTNQKKKLLDIVSRTVAANAKHRDDVAANKIAKD